MSLGALCRVTFIVHIILRNVRLTSIDLPQIEGKFTATPGGLTNLPFYGCIDSRYHKYARLK